MGDEHFKDIQEFLPKELSLEICICIIEELVDQLLILKTINGWPEVDIQNFCYKSLKQRFENSVIQEAHFEDLIPRQCSFFVSLFVKLLEEMKNEGTYSNFSNNVNILIQMKYDEENLLQEAVEKEKEVTARQVEINKEKDNYVEKILNSMAEIGKVKDGIDNFQIESKIKLAYIKSLQNSRFEMVNTTFVAKYRETDKKIITTSSKINIENKVHDDFENVLAEFTEELEEKIEVWKRKYQETLKEMIERIKALQEKQNKQLEVIANLQTLYEKRQQEIQEWNAYKTEQERIRLEKEKRNKAATIMEAWWRGTMVRKGFGKFRKKKEKKPKKSSEKTTSNKT